MDFNEAIEALAGNVKKALANVTGRLDSHENRLKAVEQYQSRLDASAKKRITTARAKELKDDKGNEDE